MFSSSCFDRVSHLNMNINFTFVKLAGVCVMSLIWLSVVNSFQKYIVSRRFFISEVSFLRINLCV
jgi:hypothetical protein